jgi:alanine dehydrogenase
MPGAVAKTSTMALTNATLPYVIRLANETPGSALSKDSHFATGVNITDGKIAHPAVAEALSTHFGDAAPDARFLGLNTEQAKNEQDKKPQGAAKIAQLN